MMVRTYGRRSRGIGRTLSEASIDDGVEDPYSFREEEPSSFSLSQDPESPQPICNITFSSQDSTRWTVDSWDNGDSSPLQLLAPVEKAKGGERNLGGKSQKLTDGRREKSMPPTATLMETQEHGEMMECVDEVNFALDGLRKGQGVRVRRASLLSLLNVCSTSQQCRLLKAQGMAKTIIDVILDLSLDDSPSNLAAASLFYILTSFGQDSYLLDTSSSIQFLVQMLKPIAADTALDKVPTISQKLIALRKDMHISRDVIKKLDSSSSELIHKVLETLVACKDLKASNGENDDLSRPELNPNWISLLTMEKACLSVISVEDVTGTVRKTGGNFKEKLREFGGLDAVFELAVEFHSNLEGLIDHGALSVRGSREGNLQCLPMLLKCLKIMENATFLSKENQSHLLGLKRILFGQGSSLSFVKLILNFIKVLSDLALLRTSSVTSSPEMPKELPKGADHCAELLLNAGQEVDNSGVSSSRSSQECSSSGRYSSDKGLSTFQKRRWFSSFQAGSLPSNGGTSTKSGAKNDVTEISSSSQSENRVIDISSTTFGSCSLTSKSFNYGSSVNGHGSKTNLGLGKRPYDYDDDMFIDLEESQDPFAFDEDEIKPSKWDMLYGRRRKEPRKQQNKLTVRGVEDRCLSLQMLRGEVCQTRLILSQEELVNEEQNGGNHHSSDTSCTTAICEKNSNLVADCLLTAIKVLMNLTNDNAIGCQQIAACGGLETLSSLIARHFPSFRVALLSEIKENTLFTDSIPESGCQTDLQLSEQELDFLVTVLGLLVNMVENDGSNRSQLAAAKVALPCLGGLDEVDTGVIPLLCSIFLANRGAGETAEEELQTWDEEEVVLQGEKEAEKMIVEAYAALLLAFLSTESKSIRDAIANYLPERSLKVLVPVLERFVTFHLTLNMISPETHKTVSEVIESCRLP